MQRLIKILFVFLPVFNIGWAQKFFTPKQLRADVDFFKNVADQVHPGFLYHTSKSEVDHNYRLLQGELTDSMDIASFFKKFNVLIQSYGDLHTYASYKNQFNEIKYTLPFSAYSSDGKLWVLKSFTTALNPGDEIISINNRTVKSIIHEMEFYTVNPDKAINPSNVFEIRHAFTVLFAAYFYQDLWADLDIRRDGRLMKINVKLLEKGEKGFRETSDFNYIVRQIYGGPEREITWNAIDSLNTIYLKIHSFDSFFKHLKHQKKLFKFSKKNDYKTLIIDVRDNPGGNYIIAGFWLQYLANKPFTLVDTSYLIRKKKIEIDKKLVKYYTRFRLGYKRDVKRNVFYQTGYVFKPKRKLKFNGDIFVLINAQSMSTASILAGFIKSNSRGILIGEETGNNYCAFCAGGRLNFELPNSAMRVQIPLNLLKLEVNQKINGCDRGVIPDLEILESLNDRINNRDIQLLRTLKLIGSR